MSAALAPLKDAKTILLTTYKRDGSAVDTPVSIAFDGGRAYFRSYDKAWKTKRMRNNPRVRAAPSTIRGKPTGPAIAASATLLEGEQARVAARALARHHRVLQAVLVPAAHRLLRYHTMHYELRAGTFVLPLGWGVEGHHGTLCPVTGFPHRTRWVLRYALDGAWPSSMTAPTSRGRREASMLAGCPGTCRVLGT
ncbi:MAG: PPOX class F420-dependent oxidoreductase [Trebonia sp.]